MNIDLGEIGSIRDVGQLHSMQFRTQHNIPDGHEFRQVVPRFLGQAQTFVIDRKSFRPVALDCPQYSLLAPVVGGKRKLPVLEYAMEKLKIIQRGPG